MEYPNFQFDITDRLESNQARCGQLHTPHGILQTPSFIFCATKAALKGVSTEQAKSAGAEIILSNTYHLLLQPSAELVAQAGGLHKFLNWDGPMLTDSGGFQIFSLGHGGVAAEIKGRNRTSTPKTLMKIKEEGATFRSYIDGRIHTLTPESSIDVQHKLGADLILVLDECTPFHSDRKYTARSMDLSHRWAKRSLNAFNALETDKQALYGIVQGGIYEDLRKESAQFVAEQPFFGQAIGGTLGGDKSQMHDVVRIATTHLHPARPTHLLGIGGLTDIWNGVEQGIDTFDCVHPTRLARHGGALIKPHLNDGKEHLNLRNARFKHDHTPIDPEDTSYASQFTCAYVHYLLKSGELLAGTLLAIHNISFMMRMMRDIRRAIREDDWLLARKTWIGS